MGATEQLRSRILERVLEQREQVSDLLELREQLRGSLFTRYGRCGKAGCTCASGRGHGPYYVLSAQKPAGFVYLAKPRVADARRQVERYRRFKKGLARLRVINGDLMSLLKRYQARALREGDRKFAAKIKSASEKHA